MVAVTDADGEDMAGGGGELQTDLPLTDWNA